MTQSTLTIKLQQSASTLDGWMTVSFQEVTHTPEDGIATSVQRQGHVPHKAILLVGGQCALTWKDTGSHVLVKLVGFAKRASPPTATYEVLLIQGPMPTKVGPLSDDELKMLTVIAQRDVLPILELCKMMDIESILEKRKLRNSLERLRKAELIDIRDHHSEESWGLRVTKEGVAYLVQGGLV
jgi:hypothetical protein